MVKTISKNAIQDRAVSSPRNFWQTVNSLLGKRISSDITLMVDGELITDSCALANEFSNFFKNKVDDLADLKSFPIRDLALQPQHRPISFSPGLLDHVLKILNGRNVMDLMASLLCLQEILSNSFQT